MRPLVGLIVISGFDREAVEQVKQDGWLGARGEWRSLEGAGPTWTASLATLMTGRPPSEHGVLSARDVGAHGVCEAARARSLATRLADLGLQTEARVCAPHLGAACVGLEHGFARWSEGAVAPDGRSVLTTTDSGSGAAPSEAQGTFLWLELSPPPSLHERVEGLVGELAAVDVSTAPFERAFPVSDPALEVELGPELAGEVARAAGARDLATLHQLLGRRRGSLAHARLDRLTHELLLDRARRLVEHPFEAHGVGPAAWVVVALDPDPASGAARLALSDGLASGSLGGVRALAALADGLVAQVQGERALQGAWSRSAPGDASLAGLELELGAGHQWSVEVRVHGATVERVAVGAPDARVGHTDAVALTVDTRAGLPVRATIETDRRAAAMRLEVRRDGEPLEAELALVGNAPSSRLPLPRLVPDGGEAWPADRAPLAVVRRTGRRLVVEGAGLDRERSRGASWPPTVLSPLAQGAFPKPSGQPAIALVRGGSVLSLTDVDFMGRALPVTALELLLPGGFDPEPSRAREWAPFEGPLGLGQLRLRRLGPMPPEDLVLDDRTRRLLERLPEGW
ncbi:MAG: hypothetical protein AAFZ65_04365 [Planctomycetota bacterium]